jgi:hypothetical protein
VTLELVADRPLRYAINARRISSTDGGRHQVFVAERVRDVVLTAAPDLRTVTGTAGRTRIVVATRPGAPAATMLRVARDAVRAFERYLGPYPYATLVVAESAGGYGVEGPGIVWIPRGIEAVRLRYLISHEIGHQWFYGLVGSDQAADPFADEAVTDMVTRYVLGLRRAPRCTSGRLDRSIYAYSAACYYERVYIAGGNLLDDLRRRMGTTAFFGALQTYLDEHRFGLGSTADLVATLDAATPSTSGRSSGAFCRASGSADCRSLGRSRGSGRRATRRGPSAHLRRPLGAPLEVPQRSSGGPSAHLRRPLSASSGSASSEPTHDPPGRREGSSGEAELDGVADQEGDDALGDRLVERHSRRGHEPRDAEEVDHDVADGHRHHRAEEPPVPAELGEAADEGAGDDEAEEIATRRAEDEAALVETDDPVQTRGAPRVDGQEEAHQHVEGEGEATPPEAEGAADEEDPEGLAGDRDGVVRQVDPHLGGEGDEQGAGDDERRVARRGPDPLGDPDGDEEVGDGQPTLGGGDALEGRNGDRHAANGSSSSPPLDAAGEQTVDVDWADGGPDGSSPEPQPTGSTDASLPIRGPSTRRRRDGDASRSRPAAVRT